MYLAGFPARRLAEEIEFSQRSTTQTIRANGAARIPRPKNLIKRTCLHCKQVYLIRKYQRATTKYCSKICKSKHESKGYTELTCKLCHRRFYRKTAQHEFRTKKQKNQSVYCSAQCYEVRQPPIQQICSCGKPFMAYQSRLDYYNHVYCSQSCYFKYGNHGLIIGDYTSKKEYETFSAQLRSTAAYLRWRKQCLERDSSKCVTCGEVKGVTVHHKIPVSSFIINHGFDHNKIEKDDTWTDLSNGITLCRSCHKKIHTRDK